MDDGIIKGTGNSRYLKTVEDALTRWPTWPDALSDMIAGRFTFDLNGINPEGWKQIGTAMDKANLLTDETANGYGLGAEAVPDDLFSILSEAALAKGVPKFTPAGMTLGDLPEGSTVKLKEAGSYVDFYVAKHNYEPGMNGSGRTLLVRRNCYDERQLHNNNSNPSYAANDMDAWLNEKYKNLLDTEIQAAIDATWFYYTTVGGSSGLVEQLQRSVFLLSITELGLVPSDANTEGTELPIASDLQIAQNDYGDAIDQWTRSPKNNGSSSALYSSKSGVANSANYTSKKGSRPIFTLPANLQMYQDVYRVFYALQEYQKIITDISGNRFGVQIQSGSYTGTGTFGKDNPCSITFDFAPQLVFVYNSDMGRTFGVKSGTSTYEANMMLALKAARNANRLSVAYGSTSTSITDYFTWDGPVFEWYSVASNVSTQTGVVQLNESGAAYRYLAIGY